MQLSVIIPAKNESATISDVVTTLRSAYSHAEILVVNDGSTDDTGRLAEDAGAKVVTQPYSKGNGAAIKLGARVAKGEVLLFMDADGQHTADEIAGLLEEIENGYDMVIGARSREGQASLSRALANGVYNKLASWMVGHKIPDLTSGFRAVRADMFRQFLDLLPNGFSYPTTITMAFFRCGYSVKFVPVKVEKRTGKSHISPLKDGVRFFLIIFRVATLYSPLKIFAPLSVGLFFTGFFYYLYLYITVGRLSNMVVMLTVASVVIFCVGLLAEQITTLLFSNSKRRE